MSLLKKRYSFKKPDTSEIDKLKNRKIEERVSNYSLNKDFCTNIVDISSLDFSNLSKFVSGFLRGFGFVTEDMSKELVESENGEMLTCYLSPELAICGYSDNGVVAMVSYKGKDMGLTQEVRKWVLGKEGYSFLIEKEGFLIVQN